MSRYIDADEYITVQFYDDMYEEWSVESMTIAECLNRYTEEGCPSTIDINRPEGEWITLLDGNEWFVYCSECKTQYREEDLLMGGSELPKFCPNCGSYNGEIRGDIE